MQKLFSSALRTVVGDSAAEWQRKRISAAPPAALCLPLLPCPTCSTVKSVVPPTFDHHRCHRPAARRPLLSTPPGSCALPSPASAPLAGSGRRAAAARARTAPTRTAASLPASWWRAGSMRAAPAGQAAAASSATRHWPRCPALSWPCTTGACGDVISAALSPSRGAKQRQAESLGMRHCPHSAACRGVTEWELPVLMDRPIPCKHSCRRALHLCIYQAPRSRLKLILLHVSAHVPACTRGQPCEQQRLVSSAVMAARVNCASL